MKPHLIQGVIYLYLFNLFLKNGEFAHIPELAKFERANGVRILYYGKDSSDMKEFVVTTADELFKSIVLKLEEVKWYTQNQQLPSMTPDYCSRCPWRKKCKANQLK
jgi:CRISPR/Cas system-associated exonuclease Cas4 (RecB family)